MGVCLSHLSDPKYGYDLVVATTQASLNSDLADWLSQAVQPVSYICFVGKPGIVNGGMTQITLANLLSLTNGVNPFDIPDKTPWDDPRIVILSQANFVGGIKMQIGMPPGVTAKDLPVPIAVLGTSASSLTFNMYCSYLSIVQNTHAAQGGGQGPWNVFTQPSGTAWYVPTSVGIVRNQLDPSLNLPYFSNSRSLQKSAILIKLQFLNSFGGWFLEQYQYDMDSASMLGKPQFVPENSSALDMMKNCFVATYAASAKQQGTPFLLIRAVIATPKPSNLVVTVGEWAVSPYVNEAGSLVNVSTPVTTPAMESVSTLNYLCAVSGISQPNPAAFDWNWVEPANVDTETGVIALNRNLVANYILQELLPIAKKYCIKASFGCTAHYDGAVNYFWDLLPGQDPKIAAVTASGPDVITISWDPQNGSDEEADQLTTGVIQIQPLYTCDVNFNGTTITVTQHLRMFVYLRRDTTSKPLNVVDKTFVDTFGLVIDQTGKLQVSKLTSQPTDLSQEPDQNRTVEFFAPLENTFNDIKNRVVTYNFGPLQQLRSIPVNDLQYTLFPGGKCFTYKSVQFSANNDLVLYTTPYTPGSPT